MEHKSIRVGCLYRVSTKSQVDKNTDDIPMQQIACRDFIKTMHGWTLEKEYLEKGVSGYKKTVNERDVLLQVKKDAESRLFDVLLVFMFDRLGRREDETPFIIEWFVEQGIEVWSVKEGQQRFDSRTDKLINYIRFWQSGGESEKIGVRVREKHTQMIKEGKFCGGVPPYGYKLVSSGTEHKGRLLKKMAVDEDESKTVRLIYQLATDNGYGGYRIAEYLNDRGVKTRKNGRWWLAAINYMLRNPVYKGYPTYGKTMSKPGSDRRMRLNPSDWLVSEIKVDELAIIDEDIWEKAQSIRSARTPERFRSENINYLNYPRQTKGSFLLAGIIKCGYCGSPLLSYESVAKWNTKSGEKRTPCMSYRCTGRSRGIRCDGQNTYRRRRIEEPVLEEIYLYLDSLEKLNMEKQINQLRNQNVKNEARQLKSIEKEISKLQKEIAKLNSEIVRSIGGVSHFTPEQLSSAIRQQEARLNELLARREALDVLDAERLGEINKLAEARFMIPGWSEEFKKASADIKKMLVSELIDKVVVYKDRLEIDFKVSCEEFAATPVL